MTVISHCKYLLSPAQSRAANSTFYWAGRMAVVRNWCQLGSNELPLSIHKYSNLPISTSLIAKSSYVAKHTVEILVDTAYPHFRVLQHFPFSQQQWILGSIYVPQQGQQQRPNQITHVKCGSMMGRLKHPEEGNIYDKIFLQAYFQL